MLFIFQLFQDRNLLLFVQVLAVKLLILGVNRDYRNPSLALLSFFVEEKKC